jgi:hypothetical protein
MLLKVYDISLTYFCTLRLLILSRVASFSKLCLRVIVQEAVLVHTQTNLTLLELHTFLLTPRAQHMRQHNGFDMTGQCLLPLESNMLSFVEAFGSLPNGFCGCG